MAGGSGWVWGRRRAGGERASSSCGLKVVAEEGVWCLWVPCLAAVLLSVLLGLRQNVGNQLFGVVLHCARIAQLYRSAFHKMGCKHDLLSH